MEGQLSLFPEDEKLSVKPKKKRRKNTATQDPTQTYEERRKRFLHYMEFKGMNEKLIEMAEGEIRIIIEALADYHDIVSEKTETMEVGYEKAVWKDRLERIKKIQTRMENSIGYSRDRQFEICRKRKKPRNDDIGEDAITLVVKHK